MIAAHHGTRGGCVRAVVAGSVLLLLQAGCTATPRLGSIVTGAALPPVVELAATPFHPQSDQQCGPAALATVLGAAGRAVTPARLATEIFLPGRAGSLQPELVGALRARGLVPYELDGGLEALLAELDGGRPVLVLQRQGLGPWPAWHYAVVVGYDATRGLMLLRSGTTERLQLRAPVFEATWERAGRWAVVALEPGTMPARPRLDPYMRAAAGLEATGQLDAALAAYRAAQAYWPDEPLPRLGVANVAAARRSWREAAQNYAEVLKLQPGAAAAVNNLAESYARLGCVDRAREVLRSGLAALPSDEPLRPALARTLAEVDARASTGAAESAACAAIAPH